MSDTQLLDWTESGEFRVRWKVMGQRGKRVIAYSLDPTWGHRTLRDALREAALAKEPGRG